MTNFTNDSRTTTIALCTARHPMPEGVVGSVFPETVNPTDLAGLQRTAEDFIRANRGKDINLVVTGLTVAAMAVVKAAFDLIAADEVAVSVTLWHYDRETGDYYPQEMIPYPEVCPTCGHKSWNEYGCSFCQD